MKLLGIDHGRSKIGLAIAEGPLAEPHSVMKVNSMEDAVEKVSQVAQALQVSRVVVGVSEGQMGKEQERFASLLKEKSGVDVVTWDETLSTHDAQSLSIQIGHRRKKRADMEDAFAAAIMLQSFLDGSKIL